MINNVMLVLDVLQNDSVIHICVSVAFPFRLLHHSAPFSNEKFGVQNFEVIPLNGRIRPNSSALDTYSIFIPQIYVPGAILSAGQS